MSENLSKISGRKGKGLEDNLFEALVSQASQNGTVTADKLKEIANDFLVGDAVTYGTTSFYDFLKEENKNKKVYVCSGSACMLAGSQDALKTELKKHVADDEIGEMCCLGRCHENAAFHFSGKNYSAKSKDEIADIFKEKKGKSDSYTVSHQLSEAILTKEFTSIKEYYSLLKQVLTKTKTEILDEIKISALRGRGGAGFPMGLKLESCATTESEQKFIVCNADEGDPGAYSDRYLLEERPHSVLFGMLIAGYVTGATKGVLYIRAEYPESVEIVQSAINKLRNEGFIGEKIFNSDFSFEFKIIKAAGAYICGEETALLNSIEGQRPEVRVRPPYPTQEGLFGKPTVINNVESFASLHWILEHGGDQYKKIGTRSSSGTKLVCLDSFFKKPGVYEVEMGTPLNTLINDYGNGFKEEVKALHIGGPLGGIVPMHKIDDLTIDFESFSENGFLLGHASIVSIPSRFPMIEYLQHLFQFTADESCGKCFPCRLGATRGEELLEKAQSDTFKIDKKLFNDLLETMEIGSLCALGGGLPLGIKNALEYFEDELKAFFI